MTDETILSELEAIADKLQIEIRYEPLESRGGLCRMKGRTFILINEFLPAEEKVEIIASELSKFDTEGMYILPKVREVIEKHKGLS